MEPVPLSLDVLHNSKRRYLAIIMGSFATARIISSHTLVDKQNDTLQKKEMAGRKWKKKKERWNRRRQSYNK